jgi:hypothetical protein
MLLQFEPTDAQTDVSAVQSVYSTLDCLVKFGPGVAVLRCKAPNVLPELLLVQLAVMILIQCLEQPA